MSRSKILGRLNVTGGGCWLFTGAKNNCGYGVVRVAGRLTLAHRLAYEIATGSLIPAGQSVLHRCDTPACCNPLHLWLGTQADNMADMAAKGRGRRRAA